MICCAVLCCAAQEGVGGMDGEAAVEDYDTPEAAAAAAAAYAASRGGKQQQESAEWRPPLGQTGDGRSAMNDRLGY